MMWKPLPMMQNLIRNLFRKRLPRQKVHWMQWIWARQRKRQNQKQKSRHQRLWKRLLRVQIWQMIRKLKFSQKWKTAFQFPIQRIRLQERLLRQKMRWKICRTLKFRSFHWVQIQLPYWLKICRNSCRYWDSIQKPCRILAHRCPDSQAHWNS